MRAVLLAALVGLAATFGGRAHAADAEAAAVEKIERELVAAIGKRDLATYDRLVADDYFVVAPGKPDRTKAETTATYREGKLVLHDLEIHDVAAHVFGDTAVVSATATNKREEDGRIVPSEVRYVRVYARRNGAWKAVTQMAAPQGRSP